MEFDQLTNEAKLLFMLLMECEGRWSFAKFHWYQCTKAHSPKLFNQSMGEVSKFIDHCHSLRYEHKARHKANNKKGHL